MSTGFDVDRYLTDAYQGEVLGEALFALAAEREERGDRVAHWRTLERLERHVKTRLRAELERRGLPADEDPAQVEIGHAAAIALEAMSPDARTKSWLENLQGFVDRFGAAVDAAPEDVREVARFVLAHEQALLGVFERELGIFERESEADSLVPVQRFLDETGAPEEPPIPEGIELMPLDPVFRDDPNPRLHLLRERAPVHRDRAFPSVVLTRYADVRRVLFDLEFLSDPRKALPDDPVRMFLPDEGEPSMLFLDDPAHKRLRNLVSRAFTPRAVERSRPIVRSVASELVAGIDGSEFDLMERLAAPLPAIVIARMLGIDSVDHGDFKAWSEAANEAFFNPFSTEEQKAASERAMQALDACFHSEIERRRAHPSDDLIGVMVQAEADGDRLSEAEVVNMCGLLLIAGNVTTTDLIGNGVRALIEHSDQLALLRKRPDLLPNAVEEMLRYDPPVTRSGRIAPRDLEIHGVPVPKGGSLNLQLAAANRDPAAFPDPDRFDIEREQTGHLSFGGGAHLCLGAHLARAEAQEAIAALIARFSKLRAGEGPLRYKQVPAFRGLAEYRVRVD